VSKEVAAAILTQTYFQSIPKAAAYLFLETIEERRPDNDDREIHGLE
jgi:hypothetical protein